MIVDRRGAALVDYAARGPSASERSARARRSRPRCAARSPPGSGRSRRCTTRCSTSPSRSRRAASCTARCASPIRRPTLDARIDATAARSCGDRAIVVCCAAAVLVGVAARAVCRQPAARGSRQPPAASATAISTRARRRTTGRPRSAVLAAAVQRRRSRSSRRCSRRRSEFVADASHELRTPLTALRLRLENGDERRRALARGRAARDASSTSSSRSRAPTRPRAAAATSTWRASRASGSSLAPLAAEPDVVGRRRPATAAVVLAPAPERVEQVLDNLLANALEASPPAARSRDGLARRRAELHVVDEGPGLTTDERARAFDRFWRAGTGAGSGLGLAIATRLVEVDGGTIELRDARGRRHRRGRAPPRRVTSGPGLYAPSRWQP